MGNIQEYFQQIQNDICDCDQRCQKCGKLKRQNQQAFPQPYPTLPYCSLCGTYHNSFAGCPYRPYITYTYTTGDLKCTHQE